MKMPLINNCMLAAILYPFTLLFLKLPSNFRILITSRPEAELEKAFPESSVVRRIHINDPQLAHGVDNDIFIYTREKLREACVDENSVWKLAKKAEGLFQWAYV